MLSEKGWKMQNAKRDVEERTQAMLIEWFKRWGVVAAAALVLLLMFSGVAVASGSGMPWEDTLSDILDSLQGPVAQFVGIVAIVITGAMFALGEGGGWFKRGLGIAFGLSIAFSAGTFIDTLGFSGGAAF